MKIFTKISALVLLPFFLTQADAQVTYTVTTSIDEDDGDLLDTNGAGTSLREAVKYSASGDTVEFDASLDGGIITLLTGQILIDKELTIDASSLPSGLTIDAASSSNHFLISDANPAQLAVSLNGLTLSNGSSTDTGSVINFEDLTLSGCHFLNNEAIGGSAIAGALHIQPDGTASILDSSFQNNTTDRFGGAVYNQSGFPVSITDTLFQGNSSIQNGGAIYNASSLLLEVTDCSFMENSGTSGGAIYNANSSQATFTNCAFRGNSATSSGGAIFNLISPMQTLINCIFQGNKANNGGAFYSFDSSIDFTNCSFQGNLADVSGGGLFLADCTVTITNTLIWTNRNGTVTGSAGSSISGSNTTPVYEYSLIQGINPLGTNLNGANPANNPFFALPADPTTAPTTAGDLRLFEGSPAIDVGDDTAYTNAGGPTTDIAGQDRFIGSAIDLGAHEGAVVTFGSLGYVNPDEDDNNNGRSNFLDYASGGDPTAPDDPTLRTVINGDLVTFSYRNNASDVIRDFENSTTLEGGSWESMVEGVDYNEDNSIDNGVQTLYTIEVIYDPVTEPKQFYRQVLTPTP